MRRFGSRMLFSLIFAAALVSAASAFALVETPLPLKLAINGADSIFVVKVTKIDANKPAAVLTLDRTLMGTPPANKITLSLAGDNAEARDQLLARIETGMSLVMIVTEKEGNQICLAYSNGS